MTLWGLECKFIHSVDSFKLNANAEPLLVFLLLLLRCYCCCYAQLSRLPNTNKFSRANCLFGLLKPKYLATYVQAHTVDIFLSLSLSIPLFSIGIHSKRFIWYVCYCHLETREYVRKFPFIWNQINAAVMLRGIFNTHFTYIYAHRHIRSEKSTGPLINESISFGEVPILLSVSYFMENFQKRE